MAVQIPAVSKEYLHGTITASVDLDEQTIEVAALSKGTAAPDDDTTWIAATWTGDAGKSRVWELLIGPGTSMALQPGSYVVWARVTDTPEVPVRKHDTLTII